MSLRGTMVVAPDAATVAAEVARKLAGLATTSVLAHGTFAVALAGGSTPAALFDVLVADHRDDIDWRRWQVFFGDERACPPDDPRSNFRLAQERLLSRVGVPPEQIHRMAADEPDLDIAATKYAVVLNRTLPHRAGEPPQLDCVLLGLGDDGHTASLFPGTPALRETSTWATRGLAPAPPRDRITLTLPVLNAARTALFTVTGAGKAEALRGVAAGNVPAALVRRNQELLWFLDREAFDAAALDPIATDG